MKKIILATLVASSSLLSLTLSANAATIRVTVQNLTTNSFLSPFSSIFHNGSFDNFNLGQAASLGIENIAEGGATSVLNTSAINAGFVAGNVGNAPITAGNTATAIFNVNAIQNRYFNFASMFVPSNDAFVGNDNPTEYALFDANGNFIPQSINVPLSEIWDAGTEINDEITGNAAIPGSGQTAAGGVTENGVVTVLPGYTPGGNFASFGFNFPTTGNVALITIEELPSIQETPEPTAILALLAVGGLGLISKKKIIK